MGFKYIFYLYKYEFKIKRFILILITFFFPVKIYLIVLRKTNRQ